MKRFMIFAVILALLLSFTACGDSKIDHFTKPTAPTQPVQTTQPTVVTQPEDSLSLFRKEIGEPLVAIADFGFPALSEEFEILDFLMDEFPSWMQTHAFIAQIPQERIIRTCDYDAWGNLLCVVPKDPAATVCVTATLYTETEPYEPIETEELYRSSAGEPILLLADIFEQRRFTVVITDSTGESVSYTPYWEYLGEENFAETVWDFSPLSEKTAYDNALDYGWYVPDDAFRGDHFWHSDYGYELELCYEPGEMYDGTAWIYEDDGTGVYEVTYQGNWLYAEGCLRLNMTNNQDGSLVIQGDFPILLDPFAEGWLGIFPTAEGVELPQFAGMEYDQLYPASITEDPYEYALSQGWRQPELSELTDTFWLSFDYAIDLLEDAVPGDNGGNAILYDVSENGAYNQSYTGTWSYEDGMLHLLLIPENENGYFVDDSFPILMLDGQLWIGRNSNGVGLPHFYGDQLADTLEQPKG